MATPPLSRSKHKRIHELLAQGLTQGEVSRRLRVAKGTVSNFARIPYPKAVVGLPPSLAEESKPFVVEGEYRALVMADVHIPFHIPEAIEATIDRGRKAKVNVVILNGDFMDCHEVSRWPRDGTKLTYGEEVVATCQFLSYLREKFPKARIICKEGNHEERLEAYILSRAEAFFGLVKLTELLGTQGLGIEWVGDQRVMRLGKLRMIHGHEYGKGPSSPVSAARWLMLRAGRHAICGHYHQTSKTTENNIDDEQVAAWSIGCLCSRTPKYRRLNRKVNHGAAIIEVSKGGNFHVDNFEIIDGKVF